MQARIAALERLVGKQALEIGVSKGGVCETHRSEKRAYVRNCRPETVSVAEGCPADGDLTLGLL